MLLISGVFSYLSRYENGELEHLYSKLHCSEWQVSFNCVLSAFCQFCPGGFGGVLVSNNRYEIKQSLCS